MNDWSNVELYDNYMNWVKCQLGVVEIIDIKKNVNGNYLYKHANKSQEIITTELQSFPRWLNQKERDEKISKILNEY